jgi:hypothetical protein
MNKLLHPKHRAEDAVLKNPCPQKGSLDRVILMDQKKFF